MYYLQLEDGTARKCPDWLIQSIDFDELGDGIVQLWENGMIDDSSAKYQIQLARANKENDLIHCPYCDSEIYPKNFDYPDLMRCKSCRNKFTVFTGTLMSETKLSYAQVWRFSYLVGQFGLNNSCRIADDLMISQKSAYYLLQKVKKMPPAKGQSNALRYLLTVQGKPEKVDIGKMVKREPQPQNQETVSREWTKEEADYFLKRKKEGATSPEIAKELNRSTPAVNTFARKLRRKGVFVPSPKDLKYQILEIEKEFSELSEAERFKKWRDTIFK